MAPPIRKFYIVSRLLGQYNPQLRSLSYLPGYGSISGADSCRLVGAKITRIVHPGSAKGTLVASPATVLYPPLVSRAFNFFRRVLEQYRGLVRGALYCYVMLVACPIRYWPVSNHLVDDTWVFAINYAAAHGMAPGRDFIFTTGPLGYLTFPQNLGGNLDQGLLFQAGLWLLLAVLFADVFFRGRFPVRNLALFSLLFGLSAPLYWFDYAGVENLFVAIALAMLLMFYRTGSWWRYLTVLVLVGVAPLIKLTAGIIGISALAGFAVNRILERRWKALPEAVLAAIVPLAVFTASSLALSPSADAFLKFLWGSADLINGYSSALSADGAAIGFLFAIEATAVLAALVWLQKRRDPKTARFHAALFAVPLFVVFKHGFVRQDIHTINFFCFAALIIGLVCLTAPLAGRSARAVIAAILIFLPIWQGTVISQMGMGRQGGAESITMLQGLFPPGQLRLRLDAAMAALAQESPVEPEIREQVGGSPIASLSYAYTPLAAGGLHLVLYPVVQRYAAYTPYLDRWNAAWIRDSGPRFLIFDGKVLDSRNPWLETPATWLEVYRWYETRYLSSNNLLLERRASPRFAALQTVSHLLTPFSEQLRFPSVPGPLFWTMNCGYSALGRLQKTLFRVPAVYMSINGDERRAALSRVLPELFTSPALGNYLPLTLPQFASLFQHDSMPEHRVDRIRLTGAGYTYAGSCEVEFLQPTP